MHGDIIGAFDVERLGRYSSAVFASLRLARRLMIASAAPPG